MTNYRALFLDIDGTILRPDHTIEESTKQAIKQVNEKGIEVFLATGRPLHEVDTIADELNIHSFIGYNGAFATYDNKEIVNVTMDASTIKQYLSVAKTHGHELVLYTSNRSLFTSLDTGEVKEFIKRFEIQKYELFTLDNINDILGITLINLNEDELALYQTDNQIYMSQVNVDGLRHCYDVIQEKVNKGSAIKTILSMLNIPKEKAIAFGDGMNDKAMLEYVGESFAMGNANPELFNYAKHRTTDVTDSGIYNGLRKLGLVD